MTRGLRIALVVVLFATTAHAQHSADDLARARALDQQGAKAYTDGRYNDAIRYFDDAYRLGGPPFELWNVAKCYLRLDQPEQAAELLEKYLATPNLPIDDREEATQQLDSLRRRPSTLTVASSPSGASVSVDGIDVAGARTPMSVTIQPGGHVVAVTLPSYAPFRKQVESKYGRAIILDAPLARDAPAPKPVPPPPPDVRRIETRADLGVMLPRYGSIGGSAAPAGIFTGTWRITDGSTPDIAVGGLVFVSGDSWDNSIRASNVVGTCTVRDAQSATALSVFAIGTAGWEIVPRLRFVAIAGLGVAGYFVGDLGGDLFLTACNPSPGIRPAFLAGGQIDFALTPAFRLTAIPLSLQIQPSFGGVRTTPVDASGLWIRATLALGVGVDF